MAARIRETEATDFALKDTRGKTVRLSDYQGKQPVVLVFNRSIH